MHNTDDLDVLVVYSASTALSSSVANDLSMHPFLINSRQSNYNLSYAYFLESCKKVGLKAGFTTSADVIGPGLCSSYWTAQGTSWTKVLSQAYSPQIFDKISPSSRVRAHERNLLFLDDAVQPFNDKILFSIFYDKLSTYATLPHFGIPTVSVQSSTASTIKKALSTLKKLKDSHPFKDDFSSKIVLKDRYGAGGNFVFKVEKNFVLRIQSLMRENNKIKFVIQPFLAFEAGYTYKGNKTATDIRLIYHHDTLLQCYVRMAKKRDFRCNEHQGGQLEYVTIKDIPSNVLEISEKIVVKLNKPNSLYALDFVVSNSGRAYFLEGNIGPGIDWDSSKKMNEKKSKQLIRSIVAEHLVRKEACLGRKFFTSSLDVSEKVLPIFS